MNAMMPPRFLGTTLAEDRVTEALDLPSAIYAEQKEAEDDYLKIGDALSSHLWAEGRTDFHHHDLVATRDVAAAMQAAWLSSNETLNARQRARRGG
jgi:hypothetical protein